MIATWLRHARRPLWRTAVAWAALAAFVFLSVGVLPSYQWLSRRNPWRERFPCDGEACGCASALECWTHCCCKTEDERLVWALENGVQPPASVRISDGAWIAAANRVRPGSATCASCVAEIKECLAQGRAWAVAESGLAAAAGARPTRSSAEPGSCCSRAGHDSDAGIANATRGSGRQARVRSAPAISGLSCKGVMLTLLAAVPAISSSCADLLPPHEFVMVLADPGADRGPVRRLETPTPPPRAIILI